METAQAEVTPVAEKAPEDDGVFKIRQPELGAKINVIGQIDLAALNQSTRPKKKSKEEKRREREEKEKIRQLHVSAFWYASALTGACCRDRPQDRCYRAARADSAGKRQDIPAAAGRAR